MNNQIICIGWKFIRSALLVATVIAVDPFSHFGLNNASAKGVVDPGQPAKNQLNTKDKEDTAVERPMIWATPEERSAILNKIERHAWAQELYSGLKARADAALPNSIEERREKLLALPLVWPKDGSSPTLRTYSKGEGNKSDEQTRWGHPQEPQLAMMKVLQDGIDCGVLYYLTGDEKYAAAASDILATVVNALKKMPVKTENSFNNGWIYETDHLLEVRIFGAQVPVIYDLVYNYLRKGGLVYDLATNTLKPFDFAGGQYVFRTYVELALNTGLYDSNWPVLESSCLLQNMLALDNPDQRTELLKHFVDTDTEHQASLRKIYEMFERPGDIWPESLNYSKHVTKLSIYHMTLVDRIYPDLKLGSRFSNIPQSVTAMYNLQFPNDDYPYIGDSNRRMAVDYLAYEMALQLAVLNQNHEQINQFSNILTSSIAKGEYNRGHLKERSYGPAAYQLPLQLLWATDDIGESSNLNIAPPRPRSTHLPHAGLTLQRNISKTDALKNSLMAVVAGASYIHGHASGMDLELYGQGYVLGIDGGKGTYASPLHENYYRLFAAHNTVISNGASATNPNGGWVNLGMDRVEPVVLEPKAGETGVSPNHSFATTRFTDEFNLVAPAEHQRTVALIRLNEEHGYYLDVFRAKSDTPNQYHDYLYRNVGDRLEITSGGKAVEMQADDQRYQAASKLEWKRNQAFQHPGWHYFEKVRSSRPFDTGFLATFTADQLGDKPIVMRTWVPAGLKTEITQASAPSSSAAPAPYNQKPLPTFLMRHHGEAWSNPFVAVFESDSGKPTVQSVERLMSGGVFKGIKVTAKVDGHSIIQYVLIQEEMNDFYSNEDLGIQFKGQFAVLTLADGVSRTSMYIGSGHELVYQDHQLKTEGESRAAYREFTAFRQTPDSAARKDKWFRDAKLGAFIHFGVYSQLEGDYKGRADWKYSEWIQVFAKMTKIEYHEVAAAFNPVEFDADEWVEVFKESGMKYVVLTSKHHDGFALFDSQVSEYNIVDSTPFKRDIVKELSQACQRHGLKFGVYYSHAHDWDEPNAPYLSETGAETRRTIHPDLPKDFEPDISRYIETKSLPQVEELMKNYQIDLVWFDTPAGITEEIARKFTDVVRKHNPDCIINSRLIRGYMENPKLLELYDYESLGDKRIPDKTNPLYTESPDSVSSSFGYKTKGEITYHTEEEIIHRFVHTVCAGGNYLLNIGPMGNGKLDPKGVRLYHALGEWLKVNGESVYGTRRYPLDEKPKWGDCSISKDGKSVYLHVMKWPESKSIIIEKIPGRAKAVAFLANGATAEFSQTEDTLTVALPSEPLDRYTTVLKVSL